MKKKILLYSVFCLLSSVFCLTSFSQDIHFSQFYQSPLLVNPALTGVFNGDMRAGINYKDQWKSIQGANPTYRTYSLSFDAGLFKKKWANSYLGAGLNVFSDKSGDTRMGTTQANLLLSSVLVVADGHQISLGVQGGYAQRSVNLNNSNLVWESQFQNEIYMQNVSSGEPASFEPFTFADFSHFKCQISIFIINLKAFDQNIGLKRKHIFRLSISI